MYLWVLNDEASFRRAFNLGATGVMTDFPTCLMDYMAQEGLIYPDPQQDGQRSESESERLMGEADGVVGEDGAGRGDEGVMALKEDTRGVSDGFQVEKGKGEGS